MFSLSLSLSTALKLGERCTDDQSCMFYDRNALCANLDDYTTQCQCRNGFHPSITMELLSRSSICIAG